ncbi:hypothetical protein BJX96DRAFT_149846 [Aspergillus floccosus]
MASIELQGPMHRDAWLGVRRLVLSEVLVPSTDGSKRDLCGILVGLLLYRKGTFDFLYGICPILLYILGIDGISQFMLVGYQTKKHIVYRPDCR